MSVTGGGNEIQDGLQVLEVGLVPEGTSDSGRVEEQIEAHDTRRVHAVEFTDPRKLSNGDAVEIELVIARESVLTEPEVSTAINDGSSGYAFNEKVAEFGMSFIASGSNAYGITTEFSAHYKAFPAPIIWQENETWFFSAFENNDADSFETHEIRVYFTEGDEATLPRQTRVTN
jgi:hypothetical protein